MPKYYLWSPMSLEVSDYGRVMKTAKVGEEVTADKLDLSKDQFKELIELGSIRTVPYPNIPDDVAPTEHFRAMSAEGTETELTNSERKELEAFRAEAAKREAEAQEKATTGGVTGKEGEQKSPAKGDKITKP